MTTLVTSEDPTIEMVDALANRSLEELAKIVAAEQERDRLRLGHEPTQKKRGGPS